MTPVGFEPTYALDRAATGTGIYIYKVKISRDRPRWPKGFRIG